MDVPKLYFALAPHYKPIPSISPPYQASNSNLNKQRKGTQRKTLKNREFFSSYLEGDRGRVDVVHVEAVAELLDPRRDLVEVDGLLAAVALEHEHAVLAFLDHLGLELVPSRT